MFIPTRLRASKHRLGRLAGLLLPHQCGHVAVALLLISILSPSFVEARAPSAPVILSISNIKLAAPVSGAQVVCHVGPAVFDPATIFPSTEVMVRNNTTGAESQWGTYKPDKGTYLNLLGAGGDVIVLHARNNSEMSEAVAGFVPNPLDTARPEYSLSHISGPGQLDQAGNYHITGGPKALIDESFPLEVFVPGSTQGPIVILPGSTPTVSDTPFDFPVTGNVGDRVQLVITDAFGNRTELGFIIKGDVPTRTHTLYPGSQYAPPLQTAAEAAGVGAIQLGVLLHGLEFTRTVGIFRLRGAVLGLEVQLSYRQGTTYDGFYGQSWESNLDARLVTRTGGVDFYDGSGKVLAFNNGYFDAANGWIAYTSPPGEHRRLRYYLPQFHPEAMFALEEPTGSRLVFDPATRLLTRKEDGYQNAISYVRNATGQVVELVDDLDRRVMLSWYDTGRLYRVTDFGGRITEMWYDSEGRLTRVVNPDGSQQHAFSYVGASSRIAAQEDANSEMLRIGYSPSTNEVHWVQGRPQLQFDADNPGITSRTEFTRLGPNTIEIRNSTGLIEELHLSSEGTIWKRRTYATAADRDGSNGYPAADMSPDALWWERHTRYTGDLQKSMQWFVSEAAPNQAQEVRTWTYMPAQLDPTLNNRIAFFTQSGLEAYDPVTATILNDSTTNDLTTEYTYGLSDDDRWPSQKTEPDQSSVTVFAYDDCGSLLERRIPVATTGSWSGAGANPDAYAIVEKIEYDTRGRPVAKWAADRFHLHGGANAEPSSTSTYYTQGVMRGYLSENRTHASDGQTVHVTSYEYDQYGRLSSKQLPTGGVWRYEFDSLDRQIATDEPEATRTYPASGGTVTGGTRWIYDGDRLHGV